jgi:hypothetical protein
MRHEGSEELIVAMKARPMKRRTREPNRTRGRLCEDKTRPSEGVPVRERAEAEERDNTNRMGKPER